VQTRARALAVLLVAGAARAQQHPPIHAESLSTIDTRSAADGSQTVEIRNIAHEVSGTNIPGRPPGERLLLRTTTRSKQVLGDIGMQATVTLEAWPLGQDPRQKPLYALTVEGADGRTVNNALFVVSRGLEDTEWWSIYKLGSGRHLFDTYVPLLSFSISRETATTRYVGLEVPPDDTKDARLKQPNVVSLITYASEDRVICAALVTCDDVKQAQILRSYADTTRTAAYADGALRVAFSQNYPAAANSVEVRIPVRGDDLDLTHARLPPRLHIMKLAPR
jgi:hypothetical protein